MLEICGLIHVMSHFGPTQYWTHAFVSFHRKQVADSTFLFFVFEISVLVIQSPVLTRNCIFLPLLDPAVLVNLVKDVISCCNILELLFRTSLLPCYKACVVFYYAYNTSFVYVLACVALIRLAPSKLPKTC